MRTLYLYLVERTDHVGYDQYDAFICAVPSAKAARSTHPNNYEQWDHPFPSWVRSDERSELKVTRIGIASPRTKRGVVLSSFNAG